MLTTLIIIKPAVIQTIVSSIVEEMRLSERVPQLVLPCVLPLSSIPAAYDRLVRSVITLCEVQFEILWLQLDGDSCSNPQNDGLGISVAFDLNAEQS